MEMMQLSGKKIGATLGLCGLCLLALTGVAFLLKSPESPSAKPSLEMPPNLFQEWSKPSLALVLSGEQHGYLLPCGCSRPQVGGLERRYNFLQLLRGKGWPVAAVDLGDVPQDEGPRKLPNNQGLIKYRYSMEALNRMDYLAVGVGKYEASLSLLTVLGEYALNNPVPRVLAANLHDRESDYPEVYSTQVKEIKDSGLKIGVAGVIDNAIGPSLKPFRVELDDCRKVVPQVLADLKSKKANLNVLLYQGSLAGAKELAADHKDFHIILCLANEEEPSSEPVRVGETLIASVGHKGRYLGIVGVYKTGKPEKPFNYRYQLVKLGEEFMTPEADESKQPIVQLMERYTKELKDQNYLSKYGQMKHPNQVMIPGKVPTYVGTGKCKTCHEAAYEVWAKSKHAQAFQTLVDKKHPSLRQYDAECIVCHTVGFGYESGYRTEQETPLLKNVGCESCHGPGSEHVKKPNDAAWYPVINPWRPPQNEKPEQKTVRMHRIADSCVICHDIDNDVHFKFEKRWPDVAHPTP
jgi:hypothetical protein